jgi:hypothetical protein
MSVAPRYQIVRPGRDAVDRLPDGTPARAADLREREMLTLPLELPRADRQARLPESANVSRVGQFRLFGAGLRCQVLERFGPRRS